jgi:hypothetical protein
MAGWVGRPTLSSQRHHRLTISVSVQRNRIDIHGKTRALDAARIQRLCLASKGEAK